jgi:hypothetical protein
MMRRIAKSAGAIQIQNRARAAKLTAMNVCRQARRREKHLFRKKKGQFDDQILIEMNRDHSVQDSHKFHKRLNDTGKQFEPAVAMCIYVSSYERPTADL